MEHVSPYLFAAWRQIHRARYKGNDIYNIQLGGTDEGYATGGTTMKYGRFFTDAENSHHMPVAVIGEDVYKALLPDADPIGKWIDVDGHEFEVIGVMNRPAASLARPGRHPRPDLPYFTMHKMFPNAQENMLIVVGQVRAMAAAAR